MNNQYDVDYFIKFFQNIPANCWTVRTFCGEDGRRCAVGHFLRQEVPNGRVLHDFFEQGMPLLPDTKEKLCALVRLLYPTDTITHEAQQTVYKINNGDHPDYKQRSPRARILAALHDAKAKAESALDAYETRPLLPITKPEPVGAV